MKPGAGRFRGTIGALLAVAAASALAGCRKENDSLIEFGLTADSKAKDQRSLTLVAGNVTQTFALPSGLSASPSFFGVYVPSSLTGMVAVSATAAPTSGCLGYRGTGLVTIPTAGATAAATIMMHAESLCQGQDGGPDAAGGAGGGAQGGAGGAGGGADAAAGGAGGGGAQGGAGGGAQGGAGGGGVGGSQGGAGGAQGGSGGGGTGGGGAGGSQGGAGGAQGGSGGGPSIQKCVEMDHSDPPSCNSTCTSDITVWATAFSPDSKLMVTGGGDGRVKVWQVSNGTVVPEGHVLTGTGFSELGFSPDGTMLTVARTGGAEIWSVPSWTKLRTLTTTSTVYGTSFSPDGTQVISVDSGALYVHSVTNPQALHTTTVSNVWSLAVSPVSSGGSLPVVITTTTGQALVYSLTASGFSGPTTLMVTSDTSTLADAAAFSPSGNLLAAGGDDGILHFWNFPVTASSQPIPPDINVTTDTAGFAKYVDSMAFWPGGNQIAIGAGPPLGGLGVWGAAPPHAPIVFFATPSTYYVTSIAVSKDGRMMAGGEIDCGCVVVCPQ
jgi:hypothetical protein